MFAGFHPRAIAAAFCLCVPAFAEPGWSLARSNHFEVYSEASPEAARAALAWFEQLRAFFLAQTGLKLDQRAPVRVIGFRSEAEYQQYRLRSTSDAYYVGTGAHDYIVLATLNTSASGFAAHEYAHLILHACELKLPPWLEEGLSEFFSTVRFGEHSSNLGGDLPARSQSLRRDPWIPLSQLLALPADSPLREDRQFAAMFYAESWAMAGMLMLSEDYGAQFPALIAAIAPGHSSAETIEAVYKKPLETIERDLRAWAAARNIPSVPLPAVTTGDLTIETSQLTPFASAALLGELLMVIGELDRAEAVYRELARQAPLDGAIAAALGTIALRKGNSEGARLLWKEAIAQGVSDADLCYNYAILADQAAQPASEIRPALERAVALRPDFDDARYTLALLEKNSGHYDAALAHFRAMRRVAPVRLYNYWIAVADTLNELGKGQEAQDAAKKASEAASTPEERLRAAQEAYIAQTDLTVQFTRDSKGGSRLATTRIPHGAPDWHPFVEAGDKVRRAEGMLKEIDCGVQPMRFLVSTASDLLRLTIPDPSHVEMHNAPPEFTCGRQSGVRVTVVYAASDRGAKEDGIIRSLEFR